MNDFCYRIDSYEYYNESDLIKKIVYPNNEFTVFIEYLDGNSNPSVDSLNLLSKYDSRLELMIKLDKGYLRLRHFRN